MHTLDDFLDFLFDGLTGYVYSPLMSAQVNPATKQRDINQQFFNWPTERAKLTTWIENSSPVGNVYVSPVIYKEPDAHKKFVKASNVVWTEYDGDDIPNLAGLPTPDCIIQSSTISHQHIYWRIDNSIPVEQVEEISRRLSRHIGADAGWNINKVLRPPYTKNHKYPDTSTDFLSFSPNGRRELTDFSEVRDDNSTTVTVTKKEDVLPFADILAKHVLTPTTVKMVMQDVPANDRSAFMMKLGYILAEEGLKEAEILSLLFVADDRVGKFKDRDDRELRLAEIAAKSWLKINADDEGTVLYNPVEIAEYEEELEWYIQDWLHSRGGLILSGPPSIGKTQLALQLCYALSTGTSFLGKDPHTPLTVVMVSLEMEIMELKYIYRKQRNKFKENEELWTDNFHTLAPDGDFGTAGIDYLLNEVKPDVIVIDSLSELAGEDLKEAESRRVMKWFKRARREYNVAIILIHHNRKANEGNKKPRTLDDLYGSFWFGKAPDTVIGLWRENEEKPIEVNSLKVRFGAKTDLRIHRDTETLTFELEGETVDNKSGEHNTPPRRFGFS